MRSNWKFCIAVIPAVVASPAFAQAPRTWVSGVGDDVNPCSRTAPCKTFAGAISKTAVAGEINVIDPGGFGAVTITKSITIDGQGPQSSILASNFNGVVINGAGVIVTLRNLSINGVGTTTGNGIRVVNAAAVSIDNVTISNFGGTGTNGRCVSIETSAANVRVTVTNSRIYNCNNQGISVAPTAGNVLLDVDRTQVTRGGASGIALINSVTASITNSLLSNNINGAGVGLQNASATANIANSVLSNNAFGVANGLGGASITRLYGNVITGNTQQGLRIDAGSVLSHGNNAIRGNAGNETPTGASLGTQ